MADNTNNTDNKEAKGNNQSILPALNNSKPNVQGLNKHLKKQGKP